MQNDQFSGSSTQSSSVSSHPHKWDWLSLPPFPLTIFPSPSHPFHPIFVLNCHFSPNRPFKSSLGFWGSAVMPVNSPSMVQGKALAANAFSQQVFYMKGSFHAGSKPGTTPPSLLTYIALLSVHVQPPWHRLVCLHSPQDSVLQLVSSKLTYFNTTFIEPSYAAEKW